MGEDAIVIVQHERDGARRIAELLGERGQSHGRNSDRDKAEIGVPIPDRDAIIQEGLLPLLPIDWWSPMGVLAGPNKGGERGELAVPGHVKTVDPKPRSGSSARGAQCISLRIAQHDRLGLRCRCERSTDEIRERWIGKVIAAAADGVSDEVRLMDCCVKMLRSAICSAESTRVIRRLANSCTMRRVTNQFTVTTEPTEMSTSRPMLSMSVGSR